MREQQPCWAPVASRHSLCGLKRNVIERVAARFKRAETTFTREPHVASAALPLTGGQIFGRHRITARLRLPLSRRAYQHAEARERRRLFRARFRTPTASPRRRRSASRAPRTPPPAAAMAYLSEDARKEAQRRMLADKFGLAPESDEDDDADAGASSSDGDSDDDAAPAPAVSARRARPPPAASAPAPAPTPAPAPGAAPAATEPSLWPGVVLADPAAGGALPVVYEYAAAAHAAATARRECRVTQITMYNTLYAEARGRRVAVDPRLICYAVGGHVRVLARGATQRALLKGHGSGVVDMELAVVAGDGASTVDGGATTTTAVLASVAEDGSLFLWMVERTDTVDEEDEDGGSGGDDDADVVVTLQKTDAIRLQHPVDGRWYQRVRFRPVEGVVLSDGNVGVAMLLLDTQSPDLRVTEVVKMNGNVKSLDRSLSNGHKSTHGAGLSAAVWLSELTIATARGAEVCLWSLASGDKQPSVDLRLQRDPASVVDDLHVLQRGEGFVILLVVADRGRLLEVWSLMGDKQPILVQQLRLALGPAPGGSSSPDPKLAASDDGDDGAFNIVAHDVAAPDFVVVSALRHKTVLVLHYRPDRACLDAITQLPVKQSVLSLCVTRDTRRVVADSARGLREETSHTELGLWCVQPTSIQMRHLPAADCVPASNKPTQVLGPVSNTAAAPLQPAAAAAPIAAPPSKPGLLPKPALPTSNGARSGEAAATVSSGANATATTSSTEVSAAMSGGTSGSARQLSKTAGTSEKAASPSTAPTRPLATAHDSGTASVRPITLLKKRPVDDGDSTGAADAAATLKVVPESANNAGSAATTSTGAPPGHVASRSALWEAKAAMDSESSASSQVSAAKVGGAGKSKVASTGKGPAQSAVSAEETSQAADATEDAEEDAEDEDAAEAFAQTTKPGTVVLDADELVAAVSAAAKKVAADFDAEGIKHAEREMAKLDSLLAAVRSTAEESVKTHVKDALKKPMKEAIIPVVSKIISQASAKTQAADKSISNASLSKMTPAWFVKAFQDAKLAPKFGDACTEMSSQARSAIKTSMAAKYEALIAPSVTAVESASADLSTASTAFVETVQDSLARGMIGNGVVSAVEQKPDVREVVNELAAEGRMTEAFEAALNASESDLVSELVVGLCEAVEDASVFFEDHALSQTTTLALVRVLGRNMEENSELKVNWLRELMLVLEPADDEIVATAPPTLQQLVGNIEMLRRNKDIMTSHPHLVKKSKMLALLISSQADG